MQGRAAPAAVERQERWAEHRRQRRGEMVEAAVRAVRRHGAAVTMDEIAAEARVAKPILYRVFRDKAELYRAVGAHVAETLLIPVLIDELTREQRPREQVAAMIDTYLRLIESEPQLYRFVVRPTLTERPVASELVDTYKQVIAKQLSRVIGGALREARLDSGGAEAWAHALVGMTHEAGDWWMETRSMTRQDLAAYLTALVWGGFAALYEAAGSAAGRSVDDLLHHARSTLPSRLTPEQALSEMERGALLIDIREDDQRRRDGLIPRATVIPRNVLEWRCDPRSRWRHSAIRDHGQRLILICNEGFQSSLAAASLQQLGMHETTDVQGGFVAWREGGLPVQPA